MTKTKKEKKGWKKKRTLLCKDKFVQNTNHFGVPLFSPYFSPIFLSNLRRLHFGGLRKKHSGSTNFSSPLLSQPKNTKIIFSFPFSILPQIFFNQMDSQSKLRQGEAKPTLGFNLGAKICIMYDICTPEYANI